MAGIIFWPQAMLRVPRVRVPRVRVPRVRVPRVGTLIVVLILLTVGCSSIEVPTPSTLPTGSNLATAPLLTPAATRSQLIAHPSGPTDVVLRMSITGGLRYPGATVEPPPKFTLYGDGRVIYALEHAAPDGSTAIELRRARLTEEQIAAIVEYALGPGGLASARERYEDVPIADDVTTNFEVHALGGNKTVAVYALGYSDPDVPDAAARATFQALAEALRDFGQEVVAGNAEDLGAFEPEAYLVTLDQPFGPLEANREWPWNDLQPADFELNNSGYRLRIVTAEQAAAIADPPTSAPNDIVVRGPDGPEYLIRVRPLLPDEVP
jgi:hypothetical protein